MAIRVPRYRPPSNVPDARSLGFSRWLLDQLRSISDDLIGAVDTDADGVIVQERLDLPAGATRRVSPTPSGTVVNLPAPGADNAGDRATLIIENPRGTVTVTASPHVGADGLVTVSLINDARQATFSRSGAVVFYSNGIDGWKTHAEVPQETSGDDTDDLLEDALGAEVLLGAPSSAFSSGRLATDSTEIDAVLTVSGVVSWALRTASVVFSKLQNIATQRIVGRNTAGSGAPEEITVHQALDWITGDEWGFDGTDDAVSFGNVYQKERTDSFSVSVWFKTGEPGITGVSDFILISNVDSTANNRGWSLYLHNNGTPHIKLTNVINTNDLDVFSNDVACNDGQLHHLVATYAGGSAPASCQLYLDGVLLSKTTSLNTLSATIVAAGNSLRLGRFGAASSFFHRGVISYVSIWGSVLSGANVTTLYNSGVRGNEAAVGTPQSLWKLDASDTTASGGINDYGSSNFDGTAEGGLTNGVRQGSLLSRGASDWNILPPGAKGSVLVSTGLNTEPSFGTVDLFAIEPQPTNTVPVNNATTLSALTALAMATNTVLLRAGANIVAQALSTNELLVRAGADIVALAVGANTVVGRAGGNIVAAQVATAQIANNAATNAIIRDSGALSVIGRSANSTGDPADISATAASDAVLRESGSTIGFGTIATGGIANNAVTDAKLRDSGALSVIGRSANSTGDPADISASAASGAVLRESGSTIGFGTVAAAGIADGAITPAKVAIIASSVAGVLAVYASFAAGAGGSADDVTIFNANAPFAFRIVKTFPWVATGVGAATLQGRSASGGGGSALSSTYDAATATESPAITSSITATTTVAASGSYFVRRSDSGIAGEWVMLIAKT